MVIDCDPNDSDWHSQYRNPSPHPGYMKKKKKFQIIPAKTEYEILWDDITEYVIKEGIPDDSEIEDFKPPAECPTPEPENDVEVIDMEPKVPDLIDLEPDPLCPPVVGCPAAEVAPQVFIPCPTPSTPDKAIDKTSVKSSFKHRKKRIVSYDDSDDSNSSSFHRHSRKKLKKHKKSKHDSSSRRKRQKSRSMSPGEICSPIRSQKRERYSVSRSPRRDSNERYKHFREDYDELYTKYKFIKPEADVKPEICEDNMYNIFGSYYCKVCKSAMNSELTWQTHINGKRHQKALKAHNPVAVISQSLPSKLSRSRYPPVPRDVVRVCVPNTVASIQSLIDTNMNAPTPGLSQVIEIHGIEKVFYYCGICDAECSSSSIKPHLEGFKHHLSLLKIYDPPFYDRFKMKNKGEIDNIIIRKLEEIERKIGHQMMTVEKEIRNKPGGSMCNNQRDTKHRIDMPGSSSHSDNFQDKYTRFLRPNTSKSDYFCDLCDSHMNSESMWQSHIVGSRHLKNLRKAPGEAPSKVKSIKHPEMCAKLQDEIEQLNLPVIGLDVIRETQNVLNGGLQYNCFLCGSCLTQIDIMDHLQSTKHKTKYLESIKYPDYLLLKQCGNEKAYWSIIDDFAYQVFKKEGPGKVEVYLIKRT